MNKYKVRVDIPGKLIFFKNRKIRTPFELTLTDVDMKLARRILASNGVTEYSIEKITDDASDDSWEDIILSTKEEIVIEDLFEEEKEPSTLLEKLMRKEKNGE
jgi:hypothetical protein